MQKHNLNPNKLIAYFEEVHSVRKSTKNWFVFDCPFCGKKDKMAVHPYFQYVKCWSCDYRERVNKFLLDTTDLDLSGIFLLIDSYGYSNQIDSEFEPLKREVGKSNIELPKGYKLITQGNNNLSNRARKYLVNRGFDIEYMSYLGIGYCDESATDYIDDYFGYIIIPFKKDGYLYYFNARDFLGRPLRYKNPSTEKFNVGKASLLWNEDALSIQDRIFIMEGVFSALTVKDEGVATMGKSVSREQIFKLKSSDVEEIVICLDSGCKRESYTLASNLIDDKKIKVLSLPEGDPNDLGYDFIMSLYDKTDYTDFSNIYELL